MTKEFPIKVKNHSDLISRLEELSKLGEEVVEKQEYPCPDCSDVYHIGNSTVRADHNAPGNGPYYLKLKIYGGPSQELLDWISTNKIPKSYRKQRV